MSDAADKRHYLREWREYRRLTQEQLAEKVGTSKSVISELETKRELSGKWLRRLAPALDTSAGYLLDHDPEKLPTSILDIWADIPEENRGAAVRMLESLRRTGT
ncbi:helix-turn-helix domain-containing protein [Caulobacter sp. 17J80-11]|uniref:helix-turn-helix domain-containing protein n=1 Tax=Caulobacter sp. 17J80-11 TaxID=2763502 RepID=UPI00165377AC|nr:helix-turn-helix transcriptional regulator [Caulobacter sp. 17J80-11]MBC6981410.1 helix-turn-helix transcriptional regulator [Caulobacter sp. 17J80-11]